MKRLRQLVTPVYGTHVHVTPKRWWSIKDRRNARVAAKLLDHEWQRAGNTVLNDLRAIVTAQVVGTLNPHLRFRPPRR